MSKTERKRIIDYIFRHPDTPEDIRQQFERWMLAVSYTHLTLPTICSV